MVDGFDRIVVAVPELASAEAEYGELLGRPPLPCQADTGALASCCFDLGNTVIELVAGDKNRSYIRGIVFAAAGAVPAAVDNSRGLDIRVCDGEVNAGLRAHVEPGELRVDHLVLRTGDAAACIALFGEQLGMRLALDQTVPDWGGRMLFFRSGKLTLEIIEPSEGLNTPDRFWGIAYQCANIDETCERLAGSGVQLSAVRAGRKAGTRVATVKSHCLGLPTLLLEAAT
jgi:catechol 2,3-dioxygenase-like lactoylglutathione lyase family enzyme